MKVAIFDFDGTLFPNETFPLLMGHLKNHPLHFQKYRNFFLRILPVYLAYKCKLYPEQKMKEYSMWSYIAAFGTSPKSEIDQFFSQIGESMSQNLSEPVLHRLEQHRREGYYTMLVSGAYEPLLHSVTKNVNFDCIIGSSILKYNNTEINLENFCLSWCLSCSHSSCSLKPWPNPLQIPFPKHLVIPKLLVLAAAPRAKDVVQKCRVLE